MVAALALASLEAFQEPVTYPVLRSESPAGRWYDDSPDCIRWEPSAPAPLSLTIDNNHVDTCAAQRRAARRAAVALALDSTAMRPTTNEQQRHVHDRPTRDRGWPWWTGHWVTIAGGPPEQWSTFGFAFGLRDGVIDNRYRDSLEQRWRRPRTDAERQKLRRHLKPVYAPVVVQARDAGSRRGGRVDQLRWLQSEPAPLYPVVLGRTIVRYGPKRRPTPEGPSWPSPHEMTPENIAIVRKVQKGLVARARPPRRCLGYDGRTHVLFREEVGAESLADVFAPKNRVRRWSTILEVDASVASERCKKRIAVLMRALSECEELDAERIPDSGFPNSSGDRESPFF